MELPAARLDAQRAACSPFVCSTNRDVTDAAALRPVQMFNHFEPPHAAVLLPDELVVALLYCHVATAVSHRDLTHG
jgi:hypothetical protein